MKAWLTQSGVDGRYLLIWLAFVLPLLFLSLLTPAAFWSGLPVTALAAYAILVSVGLPVWIWIYRIARKSECNERLAALLASWAAVFFGSVTLSVLLQISEGRFSGQSLLQTSVGFAFYGIVVMSVAVPVLFGDEENDAGAESRE